MDTWKPGAARGRGATSRRTLPRAGLAMSPVILAGVLDGRAMRSALTATPRATAAGVGTRWAGQAVPSCVVTPQLTEGPYFVDELLFRSDIREDPTDGSVREGVPLRLAFRVVQVGGDGAAVCAPLDGAMVDVWRCDALGVYSGVQDPGFHTVGQKFLRGAQLTDAAGTAEFLTIYPGWYEGRTVHTHFKERTDPDSESGYEFTSQLFYDDALTDLVHARAPYVTKGQRTLRNDGDGIFQGGGDELLLEMVEEGEGYAATIEIGVDLSAPSSPSGPGGMAPRPGGAR